MNLLNAPNPRRIVLAGSVITPPKICSIPLLRVNPVRTRDTMRIVKPRVSPEAVSRAEPVQVPAPACDETLFTNR